ncbi:NAD(P)-dependent dehydrogenase (short-subunit alcohol dehydrogenase family) [Saccharothrix tamanrassetensis]|uniref:NAD(P)-dependent dehydrogenase (Short-subunit alcohol dehydrogenase family) n=1 Tax=Saccharothrix tamanrassetensis TaxID=1051531 RepID=A0A841CH95_9PSEU|nr:SDR family oxidoreductase [Saccharothrix tamanrassetensis]MBB5956363.1 NAD(P)-dependent dehydrogenase (short-subunit alcohol dehydrogenase family) [Saccharothrix tamanrassetensis]
MKTALVTGASRGIGRAIALRLARDGVRVVVHYARDAEAAEEVVSLAGGGAFAVRATLPDEIDALFEPLTELDIVVNNAGIGLSKPIPEVTAEEFDEVFAVNVRAPFFVVQKALPLLRDGGRIVNISSGVTRIPFPEGIAYAMTKGALDTFTLSLAAALGPRGITVNTVAPGVVDTDINAAWLRDDPAARSAVAGWSVLGRVGEPSDIADVVSFVASDDARWVTGAWLDATGGSHR